MAFLCPAHICGSVCNTSSSSTLDSSSHHLLPFRDAPKPSADPWHGALWTMKHQVIPGVHKRRVQGLIKRFFKFGQLENQTLWLENTQTLADSKWDRKKKPLLAHKAAGGNIDLGSDLLWFCSRLPSAPVSTLWSQVPHASLPLASLLWHYFTSHFLPLFLTFPASSAHPPLVSLLSSLISWGLGGSSCRSGCRCAASLRSPSPPPKSWFGIREFLFLIEKK